MIIESLYCYEDENLIRDQEGDIVYDIFRLISPGRLLLLKQKKDIIYIRNLKPETIYEIVFVEQSDEER